ncbi:hypothetical protein BT93_G0928 [Corymbia citriodora subsp. variegata]|nr:hypothetical protein BT93_G0928 [Corymbia citriodora subsp. variegata]
MPVASKAAEYQVDPVGQRCSYVIYYESYIRQLKDKVQKLRDARDRVQDSIDEARRNGKQIDAEVVRWAKDVENVANEARDILEQDGRNKRNCCCKWLPNPKVRYHLGREARRTSQDILALILQSRFEEVSYESDPDGNSSDTDWGNPKKNYQESPKPIETVQIQSQTI